MGEATHKPVVRQNEAIALDTFGGQIHVEWDPAAAVTPLGQLPFFSEFLKVSGVFDAWVADCPLAYHSHHASDKRAVLATVLLSILAGHHRYAPITAMRHDGIHPELLGVAHLVSEDAARRALARIDESLGVAWLNRHLAKTTQPLLTTPWILDLDATVTCLYGKQEGAVVGDHPKKPGRPSHRYHNAWMAVAVDVPGNETAPRHRMPGIWAWLDALPNAERPALLRGDIAYGSESVLREAEARDQPHLTKLRLTKHVKALIKTWFRSNAWEEAGPGWEGGTDRLMLSGWSRARRVVVLRRTLTGEMLMTGKDDDQERFAFMESDVPTKRDEYAVLVPSTAHEIFTLGPRARDRADTENHFDELKNHWGWGGFTTQDLARCRIMARRVALGDNGWTRFVRLAPPHTHCEAISSRPLVLRGVATHTHHAGHTRLTITSLPAKPAAIHAVLTNVAGSLRTLNATAEQ